jgi:hypothetical protein
MELGRRKYAFYSEYPTILAEKNIIRWFNSIFNSLVRNPCIFTK